MYKQCQYINIKFCDVNQQIPLILPSRRQIALNKVITNRDPSRFKEGSEPATHLCVTWESVLGLLLHPL